MKNPLVAALFSIIALGAGHIYTGRALRFFIALLVFIATLLILTFGGYLATFNGFFALLILPPLFWILVIMDSVIVARKTQISIRKWYMRWYFLVGYMLALPVVVGAVKDCALPSHTGSARLGFDIYHASADTMAPLIRQGEDVLINTWCYRHHAINVGDVVLVKSPEDGNSYVRRVDVVSDVFVKVSADNASVVSSKLLVHNVEIPSSGILGCVSSVVYSNESDRIGLDLRGKHEVILGTRPHT